MSGASQVTTVQAPRFLHEDLRIPGLDERTVVDFWQWAYSEILSNRNRSVFAEFVVGAALGVVDAPRIEWDAADLRYRVVKIEVKSSADSQSWHQERPSTIQFSIRKAIVWNPETGKFEGERTRCADVYVFCHYPEQDKAKANVLDTPAWDFYVVSTAVLNQTCGDAKTLSLKAARKIGSYCKVSGLKVAVDEFYKVLITKDR